MLLDVDGTLVDTVEGQRRSWAAWVRHYGLDPATALDVVMSSRPADAFAMLVPYQDPEECLAVLHALEDADEADGCRAVEGAAELLEALPADAWALVTSNYELRVRSRFARLGLPLPELIVDADAVPRGKPSPDPYLLAADRLGTRPERCLVVEDSASGVQAGLSAGMTVWQVGSVGSAAGAHRRYPDLRSAGADILGFLADLRS